MKPRETYKKYLTEGRYYAEIRLYDENGDDWVHDIIKDVSKTPEAMLQKAIKWSKKGLKGEGRIKINVFDTHDTTGSVISKELKV